MSVLNTCQSWSMIGMTASFRNFLRKYFHKLKIASLKSWHIAFRNLNILYCYVMVASYGGYQRIYSNVIIIDLEKEPEIN